MVYDKVVCKDDHVNDSHEKGCNEKRETSCSLMLMGQGFGNGLIGIPSESQETWKECKWSDQ